MLGSQNKLNKKSLIETKSALKGTKVTTENQCAESKASIQVKKTLMYIEKYKSRACSLEQARKKSTLHEIENVRFKKKKKVQTLDSGELIPSINYKFQCQTELFNVTRFLEEKKTHQ